MKQTITRTQTAWLIAAVLLFSSAVYTLIRGSDDLLSVTFPIGVSMLLAGLINMWIYHSNRHKLHGSHWLFADGMSTAFLSIFLLFNHSVSAPSFRSF